MHFCKIGELKCYEIERIGRNGKLLQGPSSINFSPPLIANYGSGTAILRFWTLKSETTLINNDYELYH